MLKPCKLHEPYNLCHPRTLTFSRHISKAGERCGPGMWTQSETEGVEVQQRCTTSTGNGFESTNDENYSVRHPLQQLRQHRRHDTNAKGYQVTMPITQQQSVLLANQCERQVWKLFQDKSAVGKVLRRYRCEAQDLGCPLAPEEAIVVHEEQDRPQPRVTGIVIC
jgi:hypothetical protein